MTLIWLDKTSGRGKLWNSIAGNAAATDDSTQRPPETTINLHKICAPESIISKPQNLIKSYSNPIQILFKSYSNPIQIILKTYSNPIQILFKSYSNSFKILFKS